MSNLGLTPLNVASPHFIKKIHKVLSMNSRRSQTDVRKNPSFTRERSCSFRSFGLNRVQCTVQYRTVQYDLFSTKKMRRVQSSTEFSVSWQYLRVPTYSNVPPMNSRTLRNGRRTKFSASPEQLRVPTYFAAAKGDHSDL